MEMLRSFCFSDSYCCGALLLTVTGHLYQYNSLSHTLVPLSLRSLTTKLTPYELQLFTDQQLMTLSNDLQKPAPHIYGLGTSVFDQKNDSVNYLGTMIFLYSTAEYSSLLSCQIPPKGSPPIPHRHNTAPPIMRPHSIMNSITFIRSIRFQNLYSHTVRSSPF